MDPSTVLAAHLFLGLPQATVPQLRAPFAQVSAATETTSFPAAAPGPTTEEAARRRDRMVRAHTALQLTTAGTLAVTGVLGVITAVNRPTLFGDGRCASGDPVFGRYGCESLNIIHGISGVATVGAYISTMVLEAVIHEPPWAINETPGWRTVRRVMTYVHVGGMILQPLLGMLGAYPQIIGINDPQTRDDVSRTLRTVHAGVGVVTAGAFLTTVAIDVF